MVHAIVVDTNVFADYYFLFPAKLARHKQARTILDRLSDLGLIVYEPSLSEVYHRAVLVRSIDPRYVLDILNTILEHINVIDENIIHNRAAEIALFTVCRSVDAYYIVATIHADALLITNDRTMRDTL